MSNQHDLEFWYFPPSAVIIISIYKYTNYFIGAETE